MEHLFVIGTRPEVIKCAPVIHELERQGHTVHILLTSQHTDLVTPLMDFFQLRATETLSCVHDGNHDRLLKTIQNQLSKRLKTYPKAWVWVQGDTTTALAGGLAAKAAGHTLVHLEAGLRSYQYEPFPEEQNRTQLGQLADYHLCPTTSQQENLAKEGITNGVFVTGNTVIDALLWAVNKLGEAAPSHIPSPYILMTCHRREWKEGPFDELCRRLATVMQQHPDYHLVFPVHPSPEIHGVAHKEMSHVANIHLLPPCDYPQFVQLMNHCEFILTDSGGIQEEAPSVGKPVFVLRDATERPEILACGVGKKLGTDPDSIGKALANLLENPAQLQSMTGKTNPFGNGDAAKQVVSGIIQSYERT